MWRENRFDIMYCFLFTTYYSIICFTSLFWSRKSVASLFVVSEAIHSLTPVWYDRKGPWHKDPFDAYIYCHFLRKLPPSSQHRRVCLSFSSITFSQLLHVSRTYYKHATALLVHGIGIISSWLICRRATRLGVSRIQVQRAGDIGCHFRSHQPSSTYRPWHT